MVKYTEYILFCKEGTDRFVGGIFIQIWEGALMANEQACSDRMLWCAAFGCHSVQQSVLFGIDMACHVVAGIAQQLCLPAQVPADHSATPW